MAKDGAIKAVLDRFTDGPRFQVDFGNNQTVLTRDWRISKDEGAAGIPNASDDKLKQKKVGVP